MLTLNDVLTSSGKYPGRAKDRECTDTVRDNALDLVTKVNALLYDLNIEAKVSSGFRPSGINGKIKNAAKFSNHLNGFALDLEDPEDELDHVFELNLHLLEKHGLYLESPKFTKGWAHLQSVPPKSGKRVFNP